MSEVQAIEDKILAEMIDRPSDYKKTSGGIYLADKDGESSGIRPRWFKIYAVGPDVSFVQPGQYVYVEHGRWSAGMDADSELKLYLLDNQKLLMVSDEEPDLSH